MFARCVKGYHRAGQDLYIPLAHTYAHTRMHTARMHACTHIRTCTYTHMRTFSCTHIFTRVQPDVLVSEDDDAPSQSDSVCMCQTLSARLSVSLLVTFPFACRISSWIFVLKPPPSPLTFHSLPWFTFPSSSFALNSVFPGCGDGKSQS